MHVVYDLECYPNFFCAGFRILGDPAGIGYSFELSERRDDTGDLFGFITRCKRMIGFNNMYYDWPMLDHFLQLLSVRTRITAADMYARNEAIFAMPEQQKHLGLVIWKPAIEQIDLFMMHHLHRFGVALKQCEFAMRSRSIQDLPFPAGTNLTPAEMDVTLRYNAHDITQTEKMYLASLPAVQFRETVNPEWINYNDGKLGKKTFEHELAAAGVQLYEFTDSRQRRPRQTRRPDGVRLGDVILPLVRFTRAENTAVLERVKAELAVAKTPGDKFYRPDGKPIAHVIDLDGFHIDIKLGGIHGSVERQLVSASPGVSIIDADVTSYYPSIAIVHRIFMEHLGESFCDVYGRLKARRIALPKTDPGRQTLKFALNVPFGSSNDVHSIFFDPAYMLAITMNGQLMLCMLAEQLANVPGVRLIQVNTDGVTIQCPTAAEAQVGAVYEWWQSYTGMDLEFANYDRMFIRDANNYLAEDVKGKRKRVGAYGYGDVLEDGSYFWQQDQSQAVVARAAQAAMFEDVDPLDFLMHHEDPWDFLILKKAPGGSRLQLADGTQLSRHTRFYISENGQQLQKFMPPLAGKENERRIGIAAEGQAKCISIPGKKTRPAGYRCSDCGEEFKLKRDFEIHNGIEHSWKITPCNEFDGKMPRDLDFRYYLKEIQKLLID